MALIITLSILTIVSLLLVSFVSMTQGDRLASYSYSQSLKAEQLALGGLQLVVAELCREMGKDQPPSTVNGYAVYTNVTTANLLPQRIGTNSLMPNLIKISTNAPSFTGTRYSGLLQASPINSSSPSLNSRSISASRWSKIYMGSFPANANAPYWILITRKGLTNASAISPLFGTSGSTLNNPSQANANYTIGRLAYAIYDEGGLLNVNLAGYPSGQAPTALKKGPSIWADLSIPDLNIDANALLQWRNPSTAPNYSYYVTNTWSTNGFVKVATGDMTFLNRQDLIKAALNNQAGLNRNALPYLGTFSRDLNSPSWNPSTYSGSSIDYANQANSSSSTNRFLPNVRALTTFIRWDGSNAQPGEPLMTQRFPLGKLALVSDGATTASSVDIYRYFGLRRNDIDSPWVYNHGAPGNGLRIMTLNEVANLTGANAREPDFFELLKACLLTGSLGAAKGEVDTYLKNATNPLLDPNIDLQILRIGANMIDQQDADNYPTQISLNSSTVSGIEDLPYPNKILFKVVAPAPPADILTTPAKTELFFEIWNPHRAPTAAVPTPTNFRIAVQSPTIGNSLITYFYELSNGTQTGWTASPQTALNSTPIVYTLPPNQCREPWVITGGSPASTVLPYPSSIQPNGYLLQAGPKITNPIVATHYYSISITDTVFLFQYFNRGWKTYATTSGFDNSASTGLQMTSNQLHYKIDTVWKDSSGIHHSIPDMANDNKTLIGLMKSDPRTHRFGWTALQHAGLDSSGNPTWADASVAYPYINNPLLPTADPTKSLIAYGYSPFTSTYSTHRIDLYSQNTSAAPSGYVDLDSLQRRGDSAYGPNATDISYPLQSGNTTPRPVILNRPFQSVGELGYVFRDTPWKTLDLFSNQSGDSALLDAFSIETTKVTAGRVNLNTRNKEVLKALLSGACSQETGGITLSASTADTIAGAIVSTSNPSPLLNPADLATRLYTIAIPSSNKMNREVAARALGSATSTRTWNLLIDIVAQAGRYPSTTTSLDKFLVEAEKRYWLHVAIDRFSGQVIDQQLELVNE